MFIDLTVDACEQRGANGTDWDTHSPQLVMPVVIMIIHGHVNVTLLSELRRHVGRVGAEGRGRPLAKEGGQSSTWEWEGGVRKKHKRKADGGGGGSSSGGGGKKRRR